MQASKNLTAFNAKKCKNQHLVKNKNLVLKRKRCIFGPFVNTTIAMGNSVIRKLQVTVQDKGT